MVKMYWGPRFWPWKNFIHKTLPPIHNIMYRERPSVTVVSVVRGAASFVVGVGCGGCGGAGCWVGGKW